MAAGAKGCGHAGALSAGIASPRAAGNCQAVAKAVAPDDDVPLIMLQPCVTADLSPDRTWPAADKGTPGRLDLMPRLGAMALPCGDCVLAYPCVPTDDEADGELQGIGGVEAGMVQFMRSAAPPNRLALLQKACFCGGQIWTDSDPALVGDTSVRTSPIGGAGVRAGDPQSRSSFSGTSLPTPNLTFWASPNNAIARRSSANSCS